MFFGVKCLQNVFYFWFDGCKVGGDIYYDWKECNQEGGQNGWDCVDVELDYQDWYDCYFGD